MDPKYDLVLGSLNCRGLGKKFKRSKLLNDLRNTKCNIICLQDTHFTDDIEEKIIVTEWIYEAHMSSHASNSRGVAILFKNNYQFQILRPVEKGNGNYIALQIQTFEKTITLITVYGNPNEDDPDFFCMLEDIIKRCGNTDIIVCGDWNLVQDQDLDTYNYIRRNHPNATQFVLEMKERVGLYDPWRANNPYKRRYTWRQPKPIKQARLPETRKKSKLLDSEIETTIVPGYKSDHSLITLFFKFKVTPPIFNGMIKSAIQESVKPLVDGVNSTKDELSTLCKEIESLNMLVLEKDNVIESQNYEIEGLKRELVNLNPTDTSYQPTYDNYCLYE